MIFGIYVGGSSQMTNRIVKHAMKYAVAGGIMLTLAVVSVVSVVSAQPVRSLKYE